MSEKEKLEKKKVRKEKPLGGGEGVVVALYTIMYVADFSSFSRAGDFVWDRCMIGGFQVIFCYLLAPISPPFFTMTGGGG